MDLNAQRQDLTWGTYKKVFKVFYAKKRNESLESLTNRYGEKRKMIVPLVKKMILMETRKSKVTVKTKNELKRQNGFW